VILGMMTGKEREFVMHPIVGGFVLRGNAVRTWDP
jgi:hypothetical protein